MNDATVLYEMCSEAYRATDDWTRNAPGVHWVMSLSWYRLLRATLREGEDPEDDPAKRLPQPEDRLFMLPIEVRDDGGQPHLETSDRPQMCQLPSPRRAR